MSDTPQPPQRQLETRQPPPSGTIDITREKTPLRLRVVAGYLSITGGVGLVGALFASAFILGTTDFKDVRAPIVRAVLFSLGTSISSLIAARALRRREKQGALMALGLFSAPVIYGLIGNRTEFGAGIFCVLGIIGIATVWNTLD